MNIPNPLIIFQSFSIPVKMTFLICLTVLIITTIGFTVWASVQTQSFPEITKIILEKLFN